MAVLKIIKSHSVQDWHFTLRVLHISEPLPIADSRLPLSPAEALA
jgi:hypothetical protein